MSKRADNTRTASIHSSAANSTPKTQVPNEHLRTLDRDRLTFFSDALRASETGTFRWNPDSGEFVDFDENFQRLFGFAQDEPLHHANEVVARIHSEDRPGVMAALDACLQGTDFDMEYRVVLPDGTVRWLYDRARMMPSHDGQSRSVIGAITDVTRRKQNEEALRRSEFNLRDFFENASVGLHWVGPDGIILWANQTELDLLGYTHKEYIGHHIAEFHTDQPVIEDILARLTAGQTLHNYEASLRCKDDSIRHVLISSNALFENQKFVHTRCFTRDITERKQVEDALHLSEERFRSLVSVITDVPWVTDAVGAFIEPQPAWEAFTGQSWEDYRGFGWTNAIHPDDRQGVRETWERACAGQSLYESQGRIWHAATQEYRYFVARATPLLNADDRVREWVGTCTDVHVLKLQEAALHRVNDELERRVSERTQALEQSKGRLRTLAKELNLAEQRERARLATELHDYLAQLLVLGRMTLAQAKQTGLSSRAENFVKATEDTLGKALTYCRTLMAELSPPVLQERGLPAGLIWLSEHMKRQDLAVAVEIEGADDLPLPGDCAVLLFQSVRELLINVAKHGSMKIATVRMTYEDGTLCIVVRDEDGFDLLAAGPAVDTISPLSSKFGLFSIRERMIALGGSFDIQSAPGQGTTATLKLPLGRRAGETIGASRQSSIDQHLRDENAGPRTPSSRQTDNHRSVINSEAEKTSRSIRILLADDHTVLRQGLRSIVASYNNFEVVGEAADGAEAVKLAQQFFPDVVVMDINMPNMDGIEATKRIKMDHPNIVIIGLSVNQSVDTEQKMKAVGAAAYLTKENAADVLCDTIVQMVSDNRHKHSSCLGNA